MDKSSKTIYIGLGAVSLVALAIAFSPNDKPKATNKPGTTTVIVSSKAKLGDIFDKKDEVAHFDRLSTTPKNGFRPVIARRAGAHGSGASVMPNAIPTEFAGEGGWVYTGTVSTDSTPAALFENKGKTEALYVRVGEKWKKCTVQEITLTTVTLIGQAGKVHTLDLLADPPDNGKTPASSSNRGVDLSAMPLAIQGMPGSLPGAPGGTTFPMTDPSMMPQVQPVAPTSGRRGRRGGGGGGGRRGGGGGGGGATASPSPVTGNNFAPDVTVEGLPDTPTDNRF